MKQLLIYNKSSNEILNKIDLKSLELEDAVKESQQYLQPYIDKILNANEIGIEIINIDQIFDISLLKKKAAKNRYHMALAGFILEKRCYYSVF